MMRFMAPAMSQLGPKSENRAMSICRPVYPLIADIAPRGWHGRKVPKAAIGGLYSITSSAVASSEGGTVRPSMRAVSVLMTISNLLACNTGKSDALAPLRMRPV